MYGGIDFRTKKILATRYHHLMENPENRVEPTCVGTRYSSKDWAMYNERVTLYCKGNDVERSNVRKQYTSY